MVFLSSNHDMKTAWNKAFENTTAAVAAGVESAAFETFEAVTPTFQEATEADRKSGRLGTLVWEFVTADVVNRNRRVYPAAVFEEACKQLKPKIDRGQALGALDHPGWLDDHGISVRDAAIRLTSVTMHGNSARVEAVILKNPHGEQLVSVIQAGGNPGVSQRAFASWRDATDDDKKRYNLGESTDVVIAEALRLITYDVVGEPGFADAHSPAITESTKQKQGVTPMTLEELMAKHPELFKQAKEAGRLEAVAGQATAVAAAVEAAKPGIVEAATKVVTEKNETLTNENADLRGALAAVKPVLVKFGLVNEQITDTQARAQVDTLKNDLTVKAAELKTVQEQLAATRAQLASLESAKSVGTALGEIATKFKDHTHKDTILNRVRESNPTTGEQAHKIATEVATLIDAVLPKPGTTPLNAPAGGAAPEGLKADEVAAFSMFTTGVPVF